MPANSRGCKNCCKSCKPCNSSCACKGDCLNPHNGGGQCPNCEETVTHSVNVSNNTAEAATNKQSGYDSDSQSEYDSENTELYD